jgi:uncharacterized protein YndB with AHSA1/START domain
LRFALGSTYTATWRLHNNLPTSSDPTPDAIVQSVTVRAHRSRVWRAITTAAEFSQWFRVSAHGEFRAGTRVHLTSTYPGHEGTEFFIDIEDFEPERRFSWRWMPVARRVTRLQPKSILRP